MASLITRKNSGSRFIKFTDGNGKSQTITLGKVPQRHAEAIKVKVENLVSAALSHHAPNDDIARWLVNLDDRLFDKLVRVGLTPTRVRSTLQGWLEQYLAEQERELKPGSVRKLKQTKTKLLAFFKGEIELHQITTQDAAAWREFLKKLDLSEATIKTHCGNAKTLIAEAVRRKLIPENPFEFLKSGPTPSKHSYYVTPECIARVIDACPNSEWRLLFGLARYAGLRIPSESHQLTVADVNFERLRLTVRSPKTERHAGHDQRIVPITPDLMVLLQNRYDEIADGEERLITIGGKGGRMTRPAQRIITQAGIKPWERLWQTLRQSCEKQWAMTFPQYAVSKWAGHSIEVSGRHYVNDVPEELFIKAARPADENTDCNHPMSAPQNAPLKVHETDGNGQKQKQDHPKFGRSCF